MMNIQEAKSFALRGNNQKGFSKFYSGTRDSVEKVAKSAPKGDDETIIVRDAIPPKPRAKGVIPIFKKPITPLAKMVSETDMSIDQIKMVIEQYKISNPHFTETPQMPARVTHSVYGDGTIIDSKKDGLSKVKLDDGKSITVHHSALTPQPTHIVFGTHKDPNILDPKNDKPIEFTHISPGYGTDDTVIDKFNKAMGDSAENLKSKAVAWGAVTNGY
jgi:hypothetical protein